MTCAIKCTAGVLLFPKRQQKVSCQMFCLSLLRLKIIITPFADLTPYEEPTSPFWTVFLSFVCVLAAFVLVFLAIYLKKRKPTSFNEVPTVSKGYYALILTFTINYLNIFILFSSDGTGSGRLHAMPDQPAGRAYPFDCARSLRHSVAGDTAR